VSSFWQDFRYAARNLVRARGTSIVVVLTLALGIGANTSVFTLINAALFKPPPSRAADRVVWLAMHDPERNHFGKWSYPMLQAFREHATSYDDIMAYGDIPASLGGDTPARVRALAVTANYFRVLDPGFAAGRGFLPDEDSGRGAHPVVIATAAFARAQFGSDSAAVGRLIRLNGHPYTIVGVTNGGFNGAEIAEVNDLWVPIAQVAELIPRETDRLDNPRWQWLDVMAVVKPGTSFEQARTEAEALVRAVRPDTTRGNARTVRVLPVTGGLDPSNRAEAAPVLGLIMIVPLLVLLVACANVANVFIARALVRRRELAVRQAMGAQRWRLVRLLLVECVMLALIAGAAGMVAATWITAAIARLGDAPPTFASALTVDGRVFGATALLALITGVLFGVGPALASTNVSLTPALRNETVTFGRGRHRARNVFVIAQAAGSLVLLVTAGLLVRSLGKALSVNPGFDASNTVALSFDLTTGNYDAERRAALLNRILDESRAMPGIQSATLANDLPLDGRGFGTDVREESAPRTGPGALVFHAAVSTDYFATMGIQIVRGRAFDAHDTQGSQPVAVINETLARRLWPDDDPIGRYIVFPGPGGAPPTYAVIGVVRDGKYQSLTEASESFAYRSTSQGDPGTELTLVARTTSMDAGAALRALAGVIRRADPDLPVFRLTSLRDNLARSLDRQRAGAALLGVFAALALALMAIGVYGVIANGVTSRTREIGIRMSLGAAAPTVIAQFVREALVLTGVGALAGVVLSLAVSGALSSLLFGLTATDSMTFVLGVLVLGAAALAASMLPARRAARVDPAIALRAD
jgi:predicted permease